MESRMNYRKEYEGLLEQIADEADRIAMEYFRSERLAAKRKHDGSVVTVADRAIEEMARERAAKSGLQLETYGEEFGGKEHPQGRRLIIDPIDGTEEFSRGIATFGTLLGVETGGEVVAGLVSAPALGTRWRAYRGEGAWRDEQRLQVSEVGRLAEAMVITCGTDVRKDHEAVQRMRRLTDGAAYSRGFGGFWQHMLVAEGAADVGIDVRVAAWDVAPLLVIVEEAGGRATNFTGERTIYGGSLVTSNGRLHEEVLQKLK